LKGRDIFENRSQTGNTMIRKINYITISFFMINSKYKKISEDEYIGALFAVENAIFSKITTLCN